MRTNLSIEELDGFLDEPLVAVLATLREDGIGASLAGLARVA